MVLQLKIQPEQKGILAECVLTTRGWTHASQAGGLCSTPGQDDLISVYGWAQMKVKQMVLQVTCHQCTVHSPRVAQGAEFAKTGARRVLVTLPESYYQVSLNFILQ